ncbi:hypothetical protein, partial [Paratractidigestivibacter faecalis]|uniref:hypothetical protein n=1 Tax=Paratractidigestivibacter faecalis TaxID=2292441 RepID=UPI003AB35439
PPRADQAPARPRRRGLAAPLALTGASIEGVNDGAATKPIQAACPYESLSAYYDRALCLTHASAVSGAGLAAEHAPRRSRGS